MPYKSNHMKKLYLFLLVVCLIADVIGYGQIRPFTPRYSNLSVKGNIKFVSNNIIGTIGGNTAEVPPSGSSENGNNRGYNIDIDNPAPNIIFPYHSSWKYLDNGTNQGTAWQAPAFIDAAWKTGTGKFGYGDPVGPGGTVVYSGCPPSNYPLPENPTPGCGTKYITTYFRRNFNITGISNYLGFIIKTFRDDGIAIYINGNEVVRDNLPAAAAYNTTAPVAAGDDGQVENIFANIPASYFLEGNNTIAVEIHQNASTSSDLSFDLQLEGMNNNGTFNSSSADLNLTGCSKVLWAGLYWGSGLGNSANNSWRVGHDTVLLKIPGAGTYTKVVSTQTDLRDFSGINNHTNYGAFANITALVNTAAPNGTYTIANVVNPTATNINNQYGGWTIVVVYEDPTDIPRNLVVFDGFQIVSPGAEIPIAGFTTPLAGPVSCELGAVVYDGDRRLNSDVFLFKQDSTSGVGSYTDLTGFGTSGPADAFNSTISYLGTNVITRNPAHNNTHGYDADIIQLPNGGNSVLGNNQTSARIQISSPPAVGENFFLHVVTSSISIANPSFELTKQSTDINGGTFNPLDILRYDINYTNKGTDTSINSVIVDTIPARTNYLPGSLSINGVPKTDIAGDDEAEYDPIGRRVIFRIGPGANSTMGGQVNRDPNANASGAVSFSVTAANICQLLSCSNIVSNVAVINYQGKNSGLISTDKSGYQITGCFSVGPVNNAITLVGSCFDAADTTLINQCPTLAVILPASLYPGYTFYHAQPFIPANQINHATPITSASTYWAYITTPGGCSDTVRLNVLLQPCPDIDDDNDGIPDYVESNGADAGGDDDFDGTPNYADINFTGFIDNNNDGVNDNFDADLDGIPNQYDLDSDNDGIPDVVEAITLTQQGGVDQNGDGVIDNYTDTDNDGLSQNVDGNNSGDIGSGNGLGIPDLDGDGIPNYIDLDSDNDGIPDLVEAGGTDANNDGRIDAYTDSDADGFSDNVDGDVGNDGLAENTTNALLISMSDANNDGRADSYAVHIIKNMDGDSKPNPYDLDSDNDGITDVREAGFTDTDNNGFSDGTKGADGWDDTIDALTTLSIRNTDASGRPDYRDIDADNDGIPDNVEGIATSSYLLPGTADSDNDGLIDTYDNSSSFGGNGITPNDQDADGTPDYIDSDTDNDGVIDLYEGNDFNFNGQIDDVPGLSGTDTDGDGLDDFFDNNNSSIKGTSAYMGNAGSTIGDGSPGSVTVVQRNIQFGCAFERDWRCLNYVLPVEFLDINANIKNGLVNITWVVTCDKIIEHFDVEWSRNGIDFIKLNEVKGIGATCKASPFNVSHDITGIGVSQLYYRIRAVDTEGKNKLSNMVLLKQKILNKITIAPNPVINEAQINIAIEKAGNVQLKILDAAGKILLQQTEYLQRGANKFELRAIEKLQNGVYTVQVVINNEIQNIRMLIQK
jgi:uncharacterized repeat protein (TIGR01451 family)